MPTPPQGRRRRRFHVPIAIVLLALAAVALVRPPIAFAGTYTVHSCQTPSGRWTGMGGWVSSSSPATQNEDFGVATSCTSQSKLMKLEFGTTQLHVAPGRWVQWSFESPAQTHIESIVMYRSLQLGWPVVARTYGRPYLYDAWHDADIAENQIESLVPPWNGNTAGMQLAPSIASDGVAWESLNLRLRCWELMGEFDCGPFPAEVTIPRAEIGMVDEEAPRASVTGGALAGVGPVRGMGDLELEASDLGGGVYRAAIEVDGVERSRQILDDHAGSCGDVESGNSDAYEFGTPQPCPLDVAGELQLDTATLRDGVHAIRVTVEDAAGNVDVAFDASVQTHNAPVSIAAPGLSGQAAVGAQLTAGPGQWDGAPTAYDHRWLRCDAGGDDCAPVAGASHAVYVLTDADAYHRMRVEVTAENASGVATTRSAASAPVADAAGRTIPPSTAGAPMTPPALGGIQGLANPLGQSPGHVANGTPASAHARIEVAFRRPNGSTAQRVQTRYGRRWTIAGRLVDASGAGIADARIGAAWKIGNHGWVARPGTRTGADGRFTYVLLPGPSRAVRFTYFAFSDSRAVRLSNVVHAEVRAPLTIRTDRTRVSGARVVRLSGRVGGARVPRGGLLVTLQGHQVGWGWRTFHTVRTDRRGRWSTQYRFRLSSGRFGFRAVLPRQNAFPFAASHSAGVFVVVS
jgi:hypothetical protein